RGRGAPQRARRVGGGRRGLERPGHRAHRERGARADDGSAGSALQDLVTEVSGALAGLRVIDCSRLIAGGVLATILADYGADVIKVENPRGGDPLRTWLRERGELWWKVYARGKRSVTLNLAHARGQTLLRRLCRGAGRAGRARTPRSGLGPRPADRHLALRAAPLRARSGGRRVRAGSHRAGAPRQPVRQRQPARDLSNAR